MRDLIRGSAQLWARASKIKQDFLSVECFNKWIHILIHLFPGTKYDAVSQYGKVGIRTNPFQD